MHKLCAGLIDVYHYTSDRQTYKVLSQLAEGLYALFAQLSDAQIQKILICEHGGINQHAHMTRIDGGTLQFDR